MRIALTHAYSWPEVRRGAERIIYELSRALASHGHDVTVLTAGASASTAVAEGVRTVRIRRIFGDEARHEAYFGLALVPRLVAGRYDAVHSFGPQDARAAIRAKRLTGHRTVYTNLGLPVRRFWDRHPAAKAHARVVQAIDVYGCMSRYALDEFRKEYGGEGTLTPGGVNIEEFRPAPVRESRPTILFSAALGEPRKGGAVLVRALDEVVGEEPDLKLWLSGPGDPEPILAAASERVRRHIEVLPLGDANAQAERYGRAWVTALPSKSDSFGLVVVESLACGTPVAASNHSALPELITPNETGALCDPDDPTSVAEALRVALRLSRSPGIAERCRTSAAPYDWRTSIGPMFLRIYAG
jgi:glycosyltransferase involved in cell wall biosynthesis